MTNDNQNFYAYDGEGRLCAVQTYPYSGGIVAMGYIYDAEGRRVAKGTITPTSTPLSQSVCNPATNGFVLTESYVLGQGGEQLTTLDKSSNWVRTNVGSMATYDLVPNAAYMPANGLPTLIPALHFQLADPLGTRRAQISSAGEAELNCQSLPFGDQQYCYAPANAPATSDDASPLHFTGKARDFESGNDYFKYRYYASSMGRWLSPDPSGLSHADLENPQSLNLYNYVGDNPLTRTDLDGLCWKGFQWACSLGQRIDNGFHGEGFRTDRGVRDYLHKANLFLHKNGVSTEGMSGSAVMGLYGKTFQTYKKLHLDGTVYTGRTGVPELPKRMFVYVTGTTT